MKHEWHIVDLDGIIAEVDQLVERIEMSRKG